MGSQVNNARQVEELVMARKVNGVVGPVTVAQALGYGKVSSWEKEQQKKVNAAISAAEMQQRIVLGEEVIRQTSFGGSPHWG